MSSTEIQLKYKDTSRLKGKVWKNVYHANIIQKKAGDNNNIIQNRFRTKDNPGIKKKSQVNSLRGHNSPRHLHI